MKRTYKEIEKNSKGKNDKTVQTSIDKFFSGKKRIKEEEPNNLKTQHILLSQKTEELSDRPEEEIKKEEIISAPLTKNTNILFYKNVIKSAPHGDFISNIHKLWFGNFSLLEAHHGYVQWLFPNFYESRFNPDSKKLQPEEVDIFKRDKEIIDNLVKSYDLILHFFGITITDYKKPEFSRARNYFDRYKETFLTRFHNHMRVERILSHWNAVGFRPYTLKFLKFMEKEIYGHFGYKNFLKRLSQTKSIRQKEEIIQMIESPLKGLIKHNVFEDWFKLGEDKDDEKFEAELAKICKIKLDKMNELSDFFINKKE